jgi:hypothetical protein
MTNLGAPVVGGDVARSRLRLKRVFLRTLVISLVSCALVAVAALLAGTFNDTTAKILMTLAALAVHSGVAMVLAHALERQVRTILSRSGLILFAANFVVLLICIWWPGPLDAPAGRASATTLALLCAYVVAVPCADLMERRAYQPLPAVGLASCILAFVMILVCIRRCFCVCPRADARTGCAPAPSCAYGSWRQCWASRSFGKRKTNCGSACSAPPVYSTPAARCHC